MRIRLFPWFFLFLEWFGELSHRKENCLHSVVSVTSSRNYIKGFQVPRRPKNTYLVAPKERKMRARRKHLKDFARHGFKGQNESAVMETWYIWAVSFLTQPTINIIVAWYFIVITAFWYFSGVTCSLSSKITLRKFSMRSTKFNVYNRQSKISRNLIFSLTSIDRKKRTR